MRSCPTPRISSGPATAAPTSAKGCRPSSPSGRLPGRAAEASALRAPSYGARPATFLRWGGPPRHAMADERSTTPLDLTESVAGEEDPGASVDLAVRTPASPGASDQPAGAQGARAAGPTPP